MVTRWLGWLPAMLLALPSLVLASDDEIAALYQRYGVDGTLVIASLDGGVRYIHNEERAARRLLPASTFKIPNTLIALEEGAIGGEGERIPWDGRDRGWEAWNRDQTLASAFALSCVWCYQRFAERIGLARYNDYLDRLDYGNEKSGEEVTTFWLEGALAISAKEQVAFMRRLHRGQLPFKPEHIRLLKRIMVVEQTPDYTLRAKSGWVMRERHPHGWYVGYLETAGAVWLFANNIAIPERSDAQYRKRLVMEAFKAKGILSSAAE